MVSHRDSQPYQRVLVDGGYYDATDKQYYFFQSDHLGSNRVVANASGTAIQKTHYYPFGTAYSESTGQEKQPYKYNGKELDLRHGLNLYDYSARYMESTTGRFTSVDPLAEKYYSWSPYAYCFNNPLRFIDPTGMAPDDGDPEKKRPNEFSLEISKDIKQYLNAWSQMMKSAFSQMQYNAGLHYNQINSENPEILEDASNKRVQSAEDINTVNEILVTPIPAGELTYRFVTGQTISGGDIAWAVADITPIGKVGKGGKLAGNLVKIIAKDRDVIHFSAQRGGIIIEGLSNYKVEKGKLFLNALHLGGPGKYEERAGKIGHAFLFDMARDLGRQHNVTEVIIQGGQRSTGKYKGKVPSPITIKVY